jgi:hypothetical protein
VGALLIQKVLDLGPIEATADDKKSVRSRHSLACRGGQGVVLVATSARRACTSKGRGHPPAASALIRFRPLGRRSARPESDSVESAD